MKNPQYVKRFVRITRAIETLTYYPDGMRLTDLADELGTDVDELREEIRAFYGADVSIDLVGGYYEPVIEFIATPHSAELADPETAPYVRLCDLRPPGVGTKYMSLAQLADLSRAGHDRAELEPDNDALREALDVLDNGILAGVNVGSTQWLIETARQLRQAVEQRRQMRITYARTWKAGVVDRVIMPYRLTHTRRGWEVDAGVLGSDDVRTYLVSGIQDLTLLDDTFEVPDDVASRIEENRRLQPVVIVVPHTARWAVEAYAESVDVLQEDETELKLRADLLPPADIRAGLMLVSAGPDAFILEPDDIVDAGIRLAESLLTHHRGR